MSAEQFKMLCARVKISSQWVRERPDKDCSSSPYAHHWRVTLRYGKRQLTTYFSMGNAGEPEVADVISCLLSDAQAAESACSIFEDFCSEFGHDSDSIKSLKTFKTCQRTAKKLKQFFGEELQTFSDAARDY